VSARSRKKKTRIARSNYVQNFSAEDLKEYFAHRQNFYDSNEDHSEDNDYDDYEYYDMHGDD
jgi:hypothetical protein